MASKISHERVVVDAKRYQPFIHTILVSCKFQPEVARLDERLIFEWKSGLEKKGDKCDTYYKSEAIMYDLVMCIVCEGLGKAGVATELSVGGEFAAASREYAAATGIFEFLAEDHLPKWVSRGSSTPEKDLPIECNVQVAKALTILFKATGQQMAVATVLIRPGVPNYSLLAKLCKGIQEQYDAFVNHMRENAFTLMSRMDKDFFTLVTFQIELQKSLSLYFFARSHWEAGHYGLACAFLSDATVALQTRESNTRPGVPDVKTIPALKPLNDDLLDLRSHMSKLLHRWESDNSHIYFQAVPQSVPEDEKLKAGIQMGKSEKFSISEVEPVLLEIPEGALKRTDSDLARELQEKLNDGFDC